jgi:hypothetical protein
VKLKRHGDGTRRCKKAIKKKKECFRRMHLDRSANNVEWYKVAKKTVKRAVSEVRGQMYDGLYQRLGTKEGEDIYRMAKSRETSSKLNALRMRQSDS